MIRVAIDSETTKIGPGAVIPKWICASVAAYDAEARQVEARLYGNHPDEAAEFEGLLTALLTSEDVQLVFHNASFDLAVFANTWPHLIPTIFDTLEAGRIVCTKVREKLLNVSTHGRMDRITASDGSKVDIRYSLSTLLKNYTGVDREAEKQGAEDIWRLNYAMLDGERAADYPVEAAEYAKQDAIDTLVVAEHQDVRAEEGAGRKVSMKTAEFHTAADFALKIISAQGMLVDPERVAVLEDMLARELAPEKLNLLVEAGILIPAKPEMPYANGAIDKATGLPKMKKAQPEKVSETTLHAYIERICGEHGLEVKRTDKGGVSSDEEVINRLAPLDPVLGQYQHRQGLRKLVSTYVPPLKGFYNKKPNSGFQERAEGYPIVHGPYDVLKETGRTSSYMERGFPSCNVQQPHPEIRQCYVPRPGHLFLAVDYSGIELVAFAQQTYKLLGWSVHRDVINSGIKCHDFLGAQIARMQDAAFRDQCERQSPTEVYRRFQPFKESEPDWWEKYRKLAKPVGLGFPGGMGVKTMIKTAASKQYGHVIITPEDGESLKELWLETYPEAKEWFAFIKRDCIDPNNEPVMRTFIDEETGEEIEKGSPLFCYTSPMGMYRAGASYCAAANGLGLQTPTAEGAKIAVFKAVRACVDPSVGSILYGCRPVAFIHDELILEIPDDENRHERACELQKIMVDSMQMILPDVLVTTEATLTRRWNKRAKPVFDADGRLTVWEPKPKKEDDGSTQEEVRRAA